jgi:hypothetical protein
MKNQSIKQKSNLLKNIQKKSRIVEVFTGTYNSGKSEISINRALMLKNSGQTPILVDLDTVEPAYTLRPIKKELEKSGLKVIAQENYIGLGETGNVITAEQKNCLLNPGIIVIDVGYGAGGLDILEILTGIEEETNLEIYMVINVSKPETSTVGGIIEYVTWSFGTGKHPWKKFSGIISNTHFADETQKQDVIRGYKITLEASKKLKIPIKAVTLSEKIFSEVSENDFNGIPVWFLKRFMPNALW